MSAAERMLYRFINTAMRLLLRSPLHRLASGTTLLLLGRGRRTGRVIAVPVSYVEHNGRLVCCTSAAWSNWWRNLCDGDALIFYHAGQSQRGTVQVLSVPSATKRDYLSVFFARFPQTARRHGVQTAADGQFDSTSFATAVQSPSTIVFVIARAAQ